LSDAFWNNLPQLLTTLAAATLAGIGVYQNRHIKSEVQVIKKSVDGQMDKLIETTAAESRAEGKLEAVNDIKSKIKIKRKEQDKKQHFQHRRKTDR
jgi:hypothetical protein